MVPGMKSLHAAYKKVAESVLPPLSSSQFQKKGVITGEEFVRAGDYLVSTCPTWAWEAGDTSKSWSFLPPAKQFLITRNVPCLRRASAVEEYSTLLADDAEDVEREADAEGGGWLEAGAPAADADDGFEQLPQLSKPQGPLVEIGGGDEEAEEAARAAAAPGGGGQEEEEEAPLPDISALDVDAPDDDDDAVAPPPPPPPPAAAPGILRTRTYDLLITYDNYYHVPRFWLIGYDENRAPLTQAQVLEDVVSDYYAHRDRKTVSVERHPHRAGGGHVVCVHPCRHAEVMHRLAGAVAGEGGAFDVEHYMVLFLKFISSVVPTIEYDYTMAAGGR